jgi:hypothetical protein
MKIMERLSFVFKDALAKDMVEITHLTGTPWDKTIKEKGRGKRIDYSLAVDGGKGSLTSEEIRERMSEIKEVTQIFEGR